MKYLDSMLEKSTSISTNSRLKLINFLFHSLMHEANNNPNLNRLTPKLQRSIMAETIGLKIKKHTLDTVEGVDKISNHKIYE